MLRGVVKGKSVLKVDTFTRLPYLVAGLIWIAVAYYAAKQVHAALAPDASIDVLASYRAGEAVLHHTSIYAVPRWVYPPPSALFWAPSALLPYGAVKAFFAVLQAPVIAGSIVAAVRLTTKSPWAAALAGALSLVLFASYFMQYSYWLNNNGVLLAPVALAIVVLATRSRPSAMITLLALSILFKPMLAPMAVLPIVARQWRRCVIALAAIVAITIIAVPLTGGFGELSAAASNVLGGAGLTGALANHNLSLSGLADQHDWVPGTVLGPRLLVFLLLALVIALAWRRPMMGSLAAASSLSLVLMVGVMLGGTLSEAHYVITVLPLLIVAAMTTRALAGQVLLWAGFALVCLLPPPVSALLHSDTDKQMLWILAEGLLFTGALVAYVAEYRSTEVVEFSRPLTAAR